MNAEKDKKKKTLSILIYLKPGRNFSICTCFTLDYGFSTFVPFFLTEPVKKNITKLSWIVTIDYKPILHVACLSQLKLSQP